MPSRIGVFAGDPTNWRRREPVAQRDLVAARCGCDELLEVLRLDLEGAETGRQGGRFDAEQSGGATRPIDPALGASEGVQEIGALSLAPFAIGHDDVLRVCR